MKICIPELEETTIQTAIREFPEIEFIDAPDLATGCELISKAELCFA